MATKWYSIPTFKKWFKARFYLPALFSYLFSKRFLNTVIRHKKRIGLYSLSLVCLLILVLVNIKIAHRNDGVVTSYCTNFDYNNLPPTCQKIADENKMYSTYPHTPLWKDIYDETSTSSCKTTTSSKTIKVNNWFNDYYTDVPTGNRSVCVWRYSQGNADVPYIEITEARTSRDKHTIKIDDVFWDADVHCFDDWGNNFESTFKPADVKTEVIDDNNSVNFNTILIPLGGNPSVALLSGHEK